MKLKCGQDVIKKLIIKRLIKNNKSIPSTSIIVKDVPANCYCSSITGQFAFDLSKITTFKVYFWKSTDNVDNNETIKDVLLEDNTTAVDWPSFYKVQIKNALDQFTTFLNKSSLIVPTYEECDIVCVLGKNFNFLGSCYGPQYIYENPTTENKVVYFLTSDVTTIQNIKKGGIQYLTLLHEFGHAFGLAHPHDEGANSKIIPGINYIDINNDVTSNKNYTSFSAYGQNSVFNTVMSYNDILFFLPEVGNFENSLIGYPESLMPLDLLALRWLYNVAGTSAKYIKDYGVSIINPSLTENKSQTIVGSKITLTFGSNCKNISFYFSTQLITTNNIEPIVYENNRILEKEWGFYPKDIISTVSVLNFSNKDISNVFIDKDGIKVNLLINLQKNKIFNMYIRDISTNYIFLNNIYTNVITKFTIKINNFSNALVNVFFN
jgi:hypothetical protein